jgi:hypothetical protein
MELEYRVSFRASVVPILDALTDAHNAAPYRISDICLSTVGEISGKERSFLIRYRGIRNSLTTTQIHSLMNYGPEGLSSEFTGREIIRSLLEEIRTLEPRIRTTYDRHRPLLIGAKKSLEDEISRGYVQCAKPILEKFYQFSDAPGYIQAFLLPDLPNKPYVGLAVRGPRPHVLIYPQIHNADFRKLNTIIGLHELCHIGRRYAPEALKSAYSDLLKVHGIGAVDKLIIEEAVNRSLLYTHSLMSLGFGMLGKEQLMEWIEQKQAIQIADANQEQSIQKLTASLIGTTRRAIKRGENAFTPWYVESCIHAYMSLNPYSSRQPYQPPLPRPSSP